MAKEKEKTLSLEELLEEALVKDMDKLYEVPENWVWTRLGVVAKWGSGGTPSRKNSDFYVGNILWIKTGELNNKYVYDTEEKISLEAIKRSSAKLFPVNTVIIAMYGATIGKVAILGVEATTNQACACGVANELLFYKYLFYYLISQKDSFIKKGKGGAQPNISQGVIKQHECPLPPIAEQQRIVDTIESLFEKLDKAKELAQNALDSFGNRKAAILHKAFTGELTAKWREENGVSLDEWEEKELGNIIIFAKEKYDPKTCAQNIIYIGLEHIEKNGNIIARGNSEDVKSLKTIFMQGDVLYGKLRPYLNKHDIVDFSGICSTDILVIRVKEMVSNKFVNYMLNTSNFIDYSVSSSKGINLPRVSEKIIAKYKLSLPFLQEQKEIVRILDDLLDNEQRAKELCDVIKKIDLMKKAILARAFRGELGTNNPEEESAVELLKEVLKEKI
ncbi:restriction endonuclease subunit S [Lutibacter sp. B2]|nr:restriction endonuclease subunit S [Lutibacter sp. B2]